MAFSGHLERKRPHEVGAPPSPAPVRLLPYAVFFAARFFTGAFVRDFLAAVFLAGAGADPAFASAATRRSLIAVSCAIDFSRAAMVRALFIPKPYQLRAAYISYRKLDAAS